MIDSELANLHELVHRDSPIGANDIAVLKEVVAGPQHIELRQVISELQRNAETVSLTDYVQARAGLCFYYLGDHRSADWYLSNVSNDAVASYHHALVLTALGRPAAAAAKFAEASEQGYDAIECALLRAGAVRLTGNLDEAESILRGVASEAAGRAEYSFQMGCIWADRGDIDRAVEYFERAVDMEPHHSRALFRLGAENSNRGNDDEAIRLYEQSLSKPPHYLGALMNLGLLYEDNEKYNAAAYCFRRILDVDPTHERASLYLKDIEATSDMYYDEESVRNEARMAQLLSRPVTDFELSVRSRNCLQAMNIFTLGDLTRYSEHELLSGKNFGETSLHEIRDIMGAHGLVIGQNTRPDKGADRAAFMQQDLTPEEQEQMKRPLSDLNLSVRARKCVSRLSLTTIGELLQRTADELLSSRNFGVTSLNEIRSKLSEFDLKLRND